jgi:hypothetical protein
MTLPTKEQVLKALINEDDPESWGILRELTNHKDWHNSVLCRCPLCGYETTVTNVHRNCPEAPATEEVVFPMYCFEHDTRHIVTINGENHWTIHKSVPMYVVTDQKEIQAYNDGTSNYWKRIKKKMEE